MLQIHKQLDRIPDDRSLDFISPENEGILATLVGITLLAAETAHALPDRMVKLGHEILNSIGIQE